MSRRQIIEAELDVALRQHRVVMLDGLPRVGRTSLVERWVALRDDVEALPLGPGEQVAERAPVVRVHPAPAPML